MQMQHRNAGKQPFLQTEKARVNRWKGRAVYVVHCTACNFRYDRPVREQLQVFVIDTCIQLCEFGNAQVPRLAR